jgi:hypothetical protein
MNKHFSKLKFLFAAAALLAIGGGTLLVAQARYDDSYDDWGGYYYSEPEEPSPYEQGYYQGGYYEQGGYYAEGGYGYAEGNYWEPQYYSDDSSWNYQGYYQGYYEGYYEGYYQGTYEAPVTVTENVNGSGFQCNRRGHNDDKFCEPQTVRVDGVDSVSIDLSGQRYGGSQVTASVCVYPDSGEPDCRYFNQTGSGLGAERGRPGDPYNYLSMDVPVSGGATVVFYVYVKDATTNLQITSNRTIGGDSVGTGAPRHSYCSNSSCVVADGEGTFDCDSDAACAGPVPPAGTSHYSCVSCWSCGRVSGAGSDSCSSGADCSCAGPTEAGYPSEGGYEGGYQSGYQGGYEGSYQGAYEGGYQGAYEGGYQSGYQSGYQASYQGSYSHAVCTANGACSMVSGQGANQCSSDIDCPQPPPTCTMTAVPARIVIPPPQTITLTWSCVPSVIPTNCSITNIGNVASAGSITVQPTSSVTYALQCSNASGEGSATIRARVFGGEPGSLKEIVPNQ